MLKDGRIANYCNLSEERRTNRQFFELETHGDRDAFLAAAHKLGCEHAPGLRGSLKMILPAELGSVDLFRIAAAHGVEIRRLNHKRDSLQDIFLKAMGEA